METIIIKPKNGEEFKEVLSVLKSMNVRTEVFKDRTKSEILNSIEKGAKEVAESLRNNKKMKNAKTIFE